MKARAFARAQMTAVPTGVAAGSAIALALGGAYLAGGMAQDAVTRTKAVRFHELAKQGFSEDAIDALAAGGDPSAVAIARRYEGLANINSDTQGPTARVKVGPVIAAMNSRGALAEPFRVNPLEQAREVECLTEAVYYEARGETPAGQAAVAQVVLNRVHHPAFPKSVCAVVFQGAGGRGCQFSFACDGSLHRTRERGAWDRASRIAVKAISGKVVADVGSATHFHVVTVQPGWAGLIRVAQVGAHVFYRFGAGGTSRPVNAQPQTIAALVEPQVLEAPQVILASVTNPVPIKPEGVVSTTAAPAPVKAEVGKTEVAKPEAAKPAKIEATPAKAVAL